VISTVIGHRRLSVLFLAGLAASGCAVQPTNPTFRVDVDTAKSRIKEMQRSPRALSRPLLILNGWFDPGVTTAHLQGVFGRAFDRHRIVSLSFTFTGTFDRCREKVIKAVDEAFPTSDAVWTTEVDMLAVSMGALVARYAAAESLGRRRLRIARLFTIAAPHRGAPSAEIPTLDPLLHDMRAGSPFLRTLDAALPSCGYPIIPYVRLGDSLVGPENAAPPGQVPRWLPNRPFDLAHVGVAADPRILADIMLRLRGEKPFSTDPPAPLPAPGEEEVDDRKTPPHTKDPKP